MADNITHETHPKIISRLSRANGHLRSVITMIEEGKPCLEIAQQLYAVEKAVINAKRVLIHDHIDQCISDEAGSHSAEMAEFREIARFL